MKELTLYEIAKITEGVLFAPDKFRNHRIDHVVTDSRSFFEPENSIFFAINGPGNNGHRFIADLLKKGMHAFVVSERDVIVPEVAFILVSNTTFALQRLAAYYRNAFSHPVIGITGSNGKTIIKEWLYELLSDEYSIVRSPKSYNSQIGVPLSLLLINNHFNLAIIEAGISQPGEMKNLAQIIKPDIGILTNIGDAHQENFISERQKTGEKLLLFSSAAKLIFRADNKETTSIINDFCKIKGIEKVSWTLNGNDSLIRFKKSANNGNTKIEAEINNAKFVFRIPFTDDSAVENACHCFAAIYAINNNPELFLSHFDQLPSISMRLEIKKGVNSSLLINDFYNSDLASLTIALTVLNQQAKKEHLKKQVILSDIRQTGIPESDLYRQVNQLLEQSGIDEITGIGRAISSCSKLFSQKKSFYRDTEDFIKKINKNNFAGSALLIKGAREFKFERISDLLQQKYHQTVLEINMNALVHNLNIFRKNLLPSTKIMVMVKAFSYGTGDVEIAKLLQYQNVDYLAVAVADEGIELREAGIQTPLIVMNPEESAFQKMIDYFLEPDIYSTSLLMQFEKSVAMNGLHNYPVHLKIDTGMNRLGLKSDEEIEEVLNLFLHQNRLKLKSVFSHLAASDDPAFDAFTLQQAERFEKVADKIRKTIPYKTDRHLLNSAGIERFPEKQFEMVRLGIGLYGISVTGLPLESISTLKSTVSQVKRVKNNETVGYGRKGIISEEREIAVVPVGYADGLVRRLGNGKGVAFINGKRVPVIGNICMDMVMLDITGVSVKPGDHVEFFGPNIKVSEVAKKAETIPYEILSGISQRVKRVYLYE
ncbi:MAG: bifunctional UDP-N-acetylmuramoyl-tripeptide:D-alanyl-D-alanine ligase/alanine racemase [Prolixibacteraceae bacterium]|nr:bifunctional UDP-N-acetylmuramoyl-tripeptide:D-alanyl-D-alanine ligase/alanine racemase [Prolixibacteraceae bacterium]